MGDETTIIKRDKRMGEKMWEITSKVSVVILLGGLAWVWNTNARLTVMSDHVETRGSALIELRQDVRTLLDRTARIETELKHLNTRP